MTQVIYKNNGFVLPFTLFICSIMLLISVSISSILTKQIFFSILSKESQLAYYAADDAIACTINIDETYTKDFQGIFPWDPTSSNDTNDQIALMVDVVNDVNYNRDAAGLPELASSPSNITCAQSDIFKTTSPTNFYVEPTNYVRNLSGGGTDEGKTSSFYMRMDLGNNIYRCAKVTVNKTPSFRQIIAQGYSRCDNQNGSIERAVINTQQ